MRCWKCAILRSTKGMQMKNLVLSCVAAATLAGCGGGDDSTPPPSLNTVEYYVSPGYIGLPPFGTPSSVAALTYSTSGGGTEQKTIALPGSVKYSNFPVGGFMYISAQKQSADGSINVSISVNGKMIKSATSSAPYGIASVSGTCCQ